MELRVDIDHLVWDDWNLVHITKHGLTPLDAEAVIHAPHVQIPSYKQRIVVVGAAAERLLAVVVGPVPNNPGAFYPFSARPANRQERRYYYEQRGGMTE